MNTIYAARHGQTKDNLEKRILGSRPGSLTEEGIRQAGLLAKNIKDLRIGKIFSSDLARSVETARILLEFYPDLPIEYNGKLRERYFGSLEGKLITDIDWEGFWNLPMKEKRYGAESLQEFTKRIAGFVASLPEKTDANILIISHIGVMNRLNYLSNPQEAAFTRYSHTDIVEFDGRKLHMNAEKFLADA